VGWAGAGVALWWVTEIIGQCASYVCIFHSNVSVAPVCDWPPSLLLSQPRLPPSPTTATGFAFSSTPATAVSNEPQTKTAKPVAFGPVMHSPWSEEQKRTPDATKTTLFK
jgi:hypothetical protein